MKVFSMHRLWWILVLYTPTLLIVNREIILLPWPHLDCANYCLVNEPRVSRPPPTCHGRQCFTCGRCCDWYYAGLPEDWEWIRNVRNWSANDTQRWRIGNHKRKFQLREDGECNRSKYYHVGYLLYYISCGAYDGSQLVGHLCVCDPAQQENPNRIGF